MNTESIGTRLVPFGTGIEKPGDFCFDEDHSVIYIWLPGAPGPDALGIKYGDPGGPRVWGWNGNVESPTLTPSIQDGNWHGYLTNGKLISC